MSSPVLVTGAGGFVGSAIVRLLVQSMTAGRAKFSDGTPVDHVVALVRPAGSTERLEELPKTGDWSIRPADLTDPVAMKGLLASIRPRAIIHTALDATVHTNLPEAEQHRLNIAPLETLFEGLKGTPGARFVHTGSAWVLPSGETLNESVRVEPRSPYATCKAQVDRQIPILADQAGVPWINLRLFNIFGKYEKPNRLLPYLVFRLSRKQDAYLSHGNQVRDFNDVDDMAKAFLLALKVPESSCGRVYHIGSGRGTTTRHFAMTVADTTGNADRIRFQANDTADQDLPCLVADPDLARRSLGWSPVTDLESRIDKAVQWWLDRRAG